MRVLPSMDFDALDGPDVPDAIRQHGLACIQYVQRATGVVLDFSPETLPVLDHYLSTARGATDDVKHLVVPAAAAYFGEVVRQLYPARWHCPDGDIDAWRLEFERCFLHFSPTAFAREAIDARDAVEGGAGYSVAADDIDVLRGALDIFGEVTPEDYYRLSTRIEVLGPLVDRLTASALARGEDTLSYTHELYRHALDEGDAPS